MSNNIFEPATAVEPYTYPHLINYMHAIHNSFWIPEHFTFDRDVMDFKVKLTEQEREVVKRTMLAISQVENNLKTFWGRIDMRMPKTEIAMVGYAFANSEIIHQRSYSKLLTLLGLQDAFSKIPEIPALDGRTNYLKKYLKGVNSRSDKEFTKSLILFSVLIENVSLFSQFLIISSFNKYKSLMTNFNSIIGATAREETLHASFGIELVNIIRKENPDWFDQEMEDKLRRNIRKAFDAELKIIDWIFENGELEFLPKKSIQEYLKERFNKSLRDLGYKEEFQVNEELLKPTEFLEIQLTASSSFDFFNEKSTEYSNNSTFDEDTLW